MSELAIWPRTKTLRWAIREMDGLRMALEDIERCRCDPAQITHLVRRTRGRLVTIRATLGDGIDDTVTEAVSASVDGRRMAETGTGSGQSPTSAARRETPK